MVRQIGGEGRRKPAPAPGLFCERQADKHTPALYPLSTSLILRLVAWPSYTLYTEGLGTLRSYLFSPHLANRWYEDSPSKCPHHQTLRHIKSVVSRYGGNRNDAAGGCSRTDGLKISLHDRPYWIVTIQTRRVASMSEIKLETGSRDYFLIQRPNLLWYWLRSRRKGLERPGA